MNSFISMVAFVLLVESVLGGRYCPKRDITQCFVRYNECCSDDDCEVYGEICCDENCGNTCHKPRHTPQGGVHVDEDSSECELGIVTSDYCPAKSDMVCVRSVNECCRDEDCCYGEVCCQENCGKKCHQSVKIETNGTRVAYSPDCNIDPYFKGKK